ILPAARWRDLLINLTWAPATRLVFVDRSVGLQDRIDDTPSLFDIVLPGKQGGVPVHRVTEHAFVCIHLLCAGITARQQLGLFANHLLSWIHYGQAKSSRDVGTDSESPIIGGTTARWKYDGWFPQAYDDLGTCHRQRLSSSDVERDTLPAPGIHVQLQSDERFGFGIRRHAVFVSVAAKLAANDILRFQRANGLQDLNLFVADRFTIGSHRWFHRQVHQNLEQMILNYIADRA